MGWYLCCMLRQISNTCIRLQDAAWKAVILEDKSKSFRESQLRKKDPVYRTMLFGEMKCITSESIRLF